MAAVISIEMACPSVSNNYCLVWGCKSKFSRKSGVWMHTFPKDSQLKKEWEVHIIYYKYYLKKFKKMKSHLTDSTIYTYFFPAVTFLQIKCLCWNKIMTLLLLFVTSF